MKLRAMMSLRAITTYLGYFLGSLLVGSLILVGITLFTALLGAVFG